VENWSYSSREVRIKAPVGVAYDTDIALAEKLMCQAAVSAPRVLANPKPRVLLMGFGESSIDFEIRFWITDPEEGVSGVRSDVYKRLWQLFRENGIEIPFPQRDLALRDNAEFRELLAALTARAEPPVEAPRAVDNRGSAEPLRKT
jgi:small-conductance mechanosensitive channel